MTRPDVEPLREILHAALKRYLTVRPHGFELTPGQTLRQTIEVRILSTGATRTLHQNRKSDTLFADPATSVGLI